MNGPKRLKGGKEGAKPEPSAPNQEAPLALGQPRGQEGAGGGVEGAWSCRGSAAPLTQWPPPRLLHLQAWLGRLLACPGGPLATLGDSSPPRPHGFQAGRFRGPGVGAGAGSALETACALQLYYAELTARAFRRASAS